jgi:acyl-ACP thioesterase
VYVRWVLDSLPADFLQGHQLCEMILNYVQQARLGDRYNVVHTSMSDGRIATTISRNGGDGADFCKIVTRWEEKNPSC